MRQVAVTLALSLVLAGCGPSGSAMDHMIGNAGYWPNCPNPGVWVTGVITPGVEGRASIKDDDGVVHGLVWGSDKTAVVEWGRRYRIGGRWWNEEGGDLWACGGADAVIPQ
jgi:hypothetical protein